MITEWVYGTQSKRLTVYSEISDVAPGAPLVTLQARARPCDDKHGRAGRRPDRPAARVRLLNIDGGALQRRSGSSVRRRHFRILYARHAGPTAPRARPPPHRTWPRSRRPTTVLTSSTGTGTSAELPRSLVDGVMVKTSYGDPNAGTSTTPVRAQSYGVTDMKFTNKPNLHVADPALGLGYGYVVRQPRTSRPCSRGRVPTPPPSAEPLIHRRCGRTPTSRTSKCCRPTSHRRGSCRCGSTLRR